MLVTTQIFHSRSFYDATPVGAYVNFPSRYLFPIAVSTLFWVLDATYHLLRTSLLRSVTHALTIPYIVDEALEDRTRTAVKFQLPIVPSTNARNSHVKVSWEINVKKQPLFARRYSESLRWFFVLRLIICLNSAGISICCYVKFLGSIWWCTIIGCFSPGFNRERTLILLVGYCKLFSNITFKFP